VFWGNFGVFPRARRIRTVIGKPIVIEEKMEHPTPEVIDAYHAKYKEALLALHEEFRRIEDEPELKIVE
jgi:hypothetical protein